MRNSDSHPIGGRAGFFVPRSSVVRDAFFLAYGGLHWEYAEVAKMPLRARQQFVEALEGQLDYERQELEKSKR